MLLLLPTPRVVEHRLSAAFMCLSVCLSHYISKPMQLGSPNLT